MGQKSGFFTSSNGDRKYSADWLSQYVAGIISNGVYTTELTTTGGNGDMSVTVGPGRAWINGYLYSNDSNYKLTLIPADGALSRTDLVVLRLDITNRQIVLDIVSGSYGSGAPALTRTSDVYELCLAQIAVAAGTTQITTQMITDKRADETVCGIVAGAVTQLSTGELLEQLKAGFEAWFATLKTQLSGDVAGNLQNQINNLPSSLKATPATAAKYFASVTGEETVDQVLAKLGTAALTDGTSLTDIWGHEVPQTYGKIISVTTAVTATQVDLDVSQIDFTRYHKIELFVDCPALTSNFYVRVNGDSGNTYSYQGIAGDGGGSVQYANFLAAFKEYSYGVLLFYTPVRTGRVGCLTACSNANSYSGRQTLAAATWGALSTFNFVSTQAFPIGTKIAIFGVKK